MKFLILLVIFHAASAVPKSPKKGLVIPHWDRHKVGDFEAFDTVSWWYNYHPFMDVSGVKKWWCQTEEGKIPSNSSVCFPKDPEVDWIPLVYAPKGYGRRPEGYPNPPVPDNEPIVLGFNEPNMKDQSNIPPKICAREFKKLCDLYPNKTMVSPATGHTDTEWFDEFYEECKKIGCRIDYLATHLYKGSPKNRFNRLKAYSERYDNKKIWLTEFAVKLEANETKIVEFLEEFLPLLEHADFIDRYAWFITRYYPDDHNHEDDPPWFWLDSYNSLVDLDAPKLTPVGEAYNKPWHLEKYRPDFDFLE